MAGLCLLWQFRDHIMTHDWRAAPGTVISTQVFNMSSPGEMGGAGSCLVVNYRYAAAGNTYIGNRFRPSGYCPSSKPENVALFPAGGPLTVWYDVRDPGFAVLNPRYEWFPVGIWFAIVGAIAVCNWCLVRYANLQANPDYYDTSRTVDLPDN